MRIGQNPAKAIDQVPQPARVTVALITYIPFLSGYYTESLEVLKVCLGSIWENTPQPYDLLVFDNASCADVQAFLLEAHAASKIQYLVLSDKNVGKGGGWNFIFQGAPGEIVAYADSDVYFYPGWLEQSLKLLEGFPKVGMVSSRPLRTPEIYFSSTLAWARQTPGAEVLNGQYMPWEIYKEHTDSLGVSAEQAREWFENSSDWLIRYGEFTADIGAAHFQFIAYKRTLQALAPLKMDRPMGQVRSLDERLNELGYLRLSTHERFVRHMGNTLALTRGDQGGPSFKSIQPSRASRLTRKFADLPVVRRSLLWLYDRIFRLYFNRSV